MPPIPIPVLQLPDDALNPNINTNYTYTTKRTVSIPFTPTYNTISIPASYGRLNSSPSPGTIAGIILGSVFGFVFLLYLLYLGLSSGRRFGSETQTEISESSAGGMRRRRRGRVVVEEERERPTGRGDRDHIVVEESVTSRSEGDVIEVFEESSSVDRPPRRERRG
ncbi:hypothetical protein ETB97_007256, partial [Aspergillus alliaceus]